MVFFKCGELIVIIFAQVKQLDRTVITLHGHNAMVHLCIYVFHKATIHV